MVPYWVQLIVEVAAAVVALAIIEAVVIAVVVVWLALGIIVLDAIERMREQVRR